MVYFALSQVNSLCFNSQRDGILLRHSKHPHSAHEVSIPNGMEFYLITMPYSAETNVGFNSQRDGILRYTQSGIGFCEEFQFPTGWNSTQAPKYTFMFLTRFNSQRDGILQYVKNINPVQSIGFQFPTGWNSTGAVGDFDLRDLRFQFPTGWNSTQGESEPQPGAKSFNSQRDGILRIIIVGANAEK